MFSAAVDSDFLFACKLALAVFGHRAGRVLLAGGFLRLGRPGGRQAGDMDEALDLALLAIDSVDDVACACLVNLVESGNPAGPGGPGTMDDVRDARHRPLQAFWVIDRTRAQLDLGQMGCNEPSAAAWPEQ